MHAFPACLQDLGQISRSNWPVRTAHGRTLRGIGWQRPRPDPHAKKQNKVSLQLSAQSPAENLRYSISSARWRELITRAKFWKLMPTQLLTLSSKIDNVHRKRGRNSARDTREPTKKLPITPEAYQDGEVGWGEFRAAHSSVSTILEEPSAASSLNISVGAQKVRELLQKHRDSFQQRRPESHSKSSKISSDIGSTARRMDTAENAAIFGLSARELEAAKSELSYSRSESRLKSDNTYRSTPNNPEDWKSYPATAATRSAG